MGGGFEVVSEASWTLCETREAGQSLWRGQGPSAVILCSGVDVDGHGGYEFSFKGMKIFSVSPLPLTRDSWQRDIVVIARQFAAMGHDAKCVRLHSKDGTEYPGVLQVGLSEMVSRDWWASKAPDLVVANTWGDPRWNGLVSAVKSAGIRLLVRLDSSGFNSPLGQWSAHFRFGYDGERDKGNGVFPAAVRAFAKTAAFSFPFIRDAKMLRQFDLADRITIESHAGFENLARSLRWLRRADLLRKISVLPHPVVPEVAGMPIPSSKENVIMCAGRWDAYFKDSPLMARVFVGVLQSVPGWRVRVYGRNPEPFSEARASLPPDVAERMEIVGLKPHSETMEGWMRSRICLFTSRMEGNPLAAEEALCCGCTVVGPSVIPSMRTLADGDFGSMAATRDERGFDAALRGEMKLWDSGRRDPARIATLARAQFTAEAVCRGILAILA